jgi:periplasmic copper chaperone A
MSRKLFCLLAAALLSVPALAQDYTAGSLKIGHPWARATPKGAPVGGGYLSITNTGSEPDRLVGGSSQVAKKFELHEMSMDHGVMKMRPLGNGLEIPPGKTVTLSPGGLHVMFVDLKQALKQGDKIPATLEFAKAGKVQVEFTVEGMGATHDTQAGQDMKAMPGMGH